MNVRIAPDRVLQALLIESEPGAASHLRGLLAEAGSPEIRLESVHGLAAGLRRLSTPGVDVVLLDLPLPSPRVIEAIKVVQTRSPAVPIVVLGASTEGKLPLQAVQAGAQDYLLKERVTGDVLVRVARYAVERKRQEEAQRFLAQASSFLAASLNFETTVNSIARLAVPFLGESCIVSIVQPEGSIQSVASAHVDPTKAALLAEIERIVPPSLSSLSPRTQVTRSGEPLMVGQFSEESIAPFLADEHLGDLIRQLEVGSYLAVPLVARGHTLGTITLLSSAPDRYGPAELALAEDLAGRAALSMDNARLFQETRDAVRMRDEVLAVATHDLKNPLSAVRLHIELLQSLLDEERMAATASDTSRLAAERLVRIDALTIKMWSRVTALLDVAHLQEGRALTLELAPVDLVSLVSVAIREHQQTSEGHSIRLDCPETAIQGEWDVARLESVIDNLLDNAIKYSPLGGVVLVSLRTETDDAGPWVVLRVQDEGIGIPEDDLPRIFDRFYRARNARGRFRGTGIGLSGTRHIVQQHGGTIVIESVEHQGCTVTIRLPLRRQA